MNYVPRHRIIRGRLKIPHYSKLSKDLQILIDRAVTLRTQHSSVKEYNEITHLLKDALAVDLRTVIQYIKARQPQPQPASTETLDLLFSVLTDA